MKHTILSLMLAFLAGLSTLSAANYSGTCGNDLIWTLNTNDSILIIYGSGAMDDYSSSSSAPWYSYRSKIKGVNLPNELTSIGNYAFNDCSNLASITFNENLESIGSYSFYKCKALKSIYLPNSITSIGDKAFASSLATTITIEKNTPPSIGKNVFPSGTMIDNSSGLPEIVEIRTTIYVPCELVQIYQTQWKDYSSRITNIPFPYTIGILLKSQGTLLDSQNDVSVACDNGFKLSAPTYTGYHFTQWSDGNTDNPRSVDVASNTVFTAEYEINYYSLHLSCDTSKGSVSPLEGTYAHSSDVVISATPKQGFKFQRWSDADTNNPRTLTLYKDVELSAIFVAEDPIKAISVNGELIPIADTMFVYDEHESTYIPQIETLTKSETANAEVVRLDNTDYGWNAVVHIKESNVILKEYTLFIFSNSNKQKVRITLTGEDRTSFSLSSNTDAFSSVVGNTRHETKYNTFSSYTGYKLGNKPSHIGLLFPLGTLQQGDIVSVLLTQESDIGEGEMFFYSDEGITPIKTIQGVYKPGLYSFVLGNNAPQLRSIYLYRNDMEMNPYVAYLEISRIHSAFTYSISCNELQGQVNIENNIGIIKAEAIPNKGYHFTQWSDGVTDNLRTIILTQDTVITAEFSANKYDISVTCDTTQGSIAGVSGEFDYMSNLTYRAIPNNGYQFSIWSDGVTDNPRTIVLTRDTVITALYNINYYKVDFVDWDNSILKSDSVEYLFAAVPPTDPAREGYTFIGWDKEVPSVTQDTVITALYNINYYKVDFVDWDNSILKSDSVEYLSAAVPPANPTREGYTFISWDKEVSAVTQDTVIQALYSINRYTISVTCDSLQGTIEGASGEYDYLTQLSYTAIPNVGYTFTQWSDGITDNPRTIILTQDTTFTAEFWMEGNCLLLSETRGDSIKWELSCDSILTIEGNGTWGGSEQFNFAANKKAVKKVIIKDGVKRIGAMSFLGLENIVSIEIPNSVTSIGDAAFGHCSSLTSITLPTNLTSLGKRAFNACTSLTTIVWNAKNCFAYTDNTYSSFYSVKGNITTFVIGDSVEYLPSELCSGMNKLSAVHISDIAAWCRINFENSKTANPLYYAHHLYLNNEEIINLVIPEGVTEISNRAFAGYSAMKTVSIPSTVVRIGHTAFDGCTGLTSVVIPDGVTTIGNTAFTRCSNLQSVVLGDNVTTIGEGVFTECTSLKSPIYNRHTFLCMPTSYSGAYLVPDGIKTIAGSAFYKCKGLTSIDIPNSVTALGEAAFRECTKLEEVTIGTGVTALGKNVFNKCASIKKVQWNAINYRQSKPNTDTNCFPFYASRDSITSFIFGDSVEYIPVYLLKDFSAINNLVIPASVTEIGEYAFTNDTLVEITCYAETPPVIDSTAVVGVNKSTCILYVPYTSVNAYRNAEVWKEFVNIQAIGAEEVEEPGDAIVVTPSSTSASLIWTLISNAATYELVIRDMNGNVICTLTFNALGQLTGIAFAPNRSRETQQTQAAGFQFTVSGLNSGTTYEYALTAFDENDNIIETLTGTFTTTNDVSTDIEQMNEDALNIPQKIMRDGNVYILRGDKVFTLHGQEVK